MKKKLTTIFFSVATIGIMILIFMFSSQNSEDSSELSGGFIRTIIDALPFFAHTDAARKAEIVKSIHNFVRKTAHFSIYAALGFCSAGSVIRYPPKKKKIIVYLCASAFCMAYAATDEFHQSFSPGRSCELRDVIIDTCGGAVGAGLYLLPVTVIYWLKNRKIKKGG